MAAPSSQRSLNSSLLVRLRAGDASGWNSLAKLYAPVVERWCHRLGVRNHDVADVSQEVFRSLVVHMSEFERAGGTGSFRRWLWVITRNKVRDLQRRQAKQPLAAGGTDAQIRVAEVPDLLNADAEPIADDSERNSLIRSGLELVRADFQDRTWQAFWRVTVDEQPADVVAKELKMSLGALYVARSRVMARLREELEGLVDLS